jgi:hypothetical protein
MVKDQSNPHLAAPNYNTAISDYPDLISDSDVVMGHARIIPSVVEKVTDKATIKMSFGDTTVRGAVCGVDQGQNATPHAVMKHCHNVLGRGHISQRSATRPPSSSVLATRQWVALL